jgi:hypothetical protein
MMVRSPESLRDEVFGNFLEKGDFRATPLKELPDDPKAASSGKKRSSSGNKRRSREGKELIFKSPTKTMTRMSPSPKKMRTN